MTYKERKQDICEQCNHYNDCAYRSRGLEDSCLHVSDIMDGWELGWQDAIKKACEWLKENASDYLKDENYKLPILDVLDMIDNFKNDMEENQ